MIQSLAEYYRSLIPECRDLPLEVFIDATLGNEWAIVDLHERDCYPIIGKDGLPIFSANVTAKEILGNTTRIIYSGLQISSQPQASTKELDHQEFLTQILLDEVGKQLQLVSLDSKCRFTPGKIINTIRQCSPPNL